MKKRKISKTIPASDEIWPKLLNGHESTAQAERRQQLFQQFWEQRQVKLEETLECLDEAPLNELEHFISEAYNLRQDGRIPTAMLVPDRQSQNQPRAIERLKQTLNSNPSAHVLTELPSRQCPNLQLALKTIIRSVLTEVAGADEYVHFLNQNKRLYPLNFDLELLQLFLTQRKSESRIVLYLDSAEEFDGQTFSDLVRTLHSWSDRIPFILLLGITTTISLFESRLPKGTIKCLRAREFAFQAPANLETRLIDVFQYSSTFLGPDMVKAVRDTIASQTSTILSVRAMIKHAYMAHYYTNPLTVLLDPDLTNTAEKFDQDEKKNLAQAIRNTRAFQQYIEGSIGRNAQSAKSHLNDIAKLLDSDEVLLDTVREHVSLSQKSYLLACSMATVLTMIHSELYKSHINSSDPKQRPRSSLDLYAELYSNLDDMSQTSTFHEIELLLIGAHSKQDSPVDLQHLRSPDTGSPTSSELISSEKLLQIILDGIAKESSSDVEHESIPDFLDLKCKQHKSSTGKDTKALLRRTGSNMMERLKLVTLLASCDLNDPSMFMRDVCIIRPATTSTTKAAFRPRIRYSIERALSTPEDYLGAFVQDDAPPPAASILFGLLQEAPQTINVRDLYDAFASRLNENPTEADDETDEKQSKLTMALFYRALSELRMIGLVKSSSGTVVKRKSAKNNNADVDFIAKTSWAGL